MQKRDLRWNITIWAWELPNQDPKEELLCITQPKEDQDKAKHELDKRDKVHSTNEKYGQEEQGAETNGENGKGDDS